MEFSLKWAGEKERNLFTLDTPETQRQFFYRQYWEIIKEVVENLPKDAKILEIGCGRGTLCQYLKSAGYENLTLLDESAEALALARENMGYGAHLVKADALALPLEDETYDLVLSMGVSEHIDNFPKFFYEQLRVLKKGGYMICITVPKKRSIQMLNVFGRDRYYRSENTVAQYKAFLEKMTDYKVAELWTNPYPLFTPIPRWLDCGITAVYRAMHKARSYFMTHPFSGSRALSQSHFLITRRSS